ncbi:recombinase family protein [Nocardioides sp. HB32]
MADALPAAIYCRISRDREGAGLGVERQEADCRALAKRLGWEVVAVYVDNDISAYSGKPRPQYRAMLDAVRARQVQGIVAWHSDRLHRRPTELEEFITLAEERDLQVQTVRAGTLDLSTPSGRMVARMLGAAARHEVDSTRDRVRRKKQELAEAGKYRGGPRPYGFDSDGVTVRKKEAEVIRHATKAVLSGRTLAAVVRELNERGSRSSTGAEWTRHSLRDVLLRHRNAGLVATGRRGEAEQITEAVWPAIVEREEFEAVRRLLLDSTRRTSTGTEPKWLGAGIYLCGRCGSVMRSFTVPRARIDKKTGKPVRLPAYRCQENDHLTIMAVKTDEYVREVVAELVRDPRVVEAMTAGTADPLQGDRERRALLVTRLQQTEADYDEDLIDARRYKAKTERLTAELVEVEARLADAAQQAVISPVFSAVDPGAAFLAAPLDVQRGVLRSVLRVEVQPYTGPRGGAWSSERLEITSAVV